MKNLKNKLVSLLALAIISYGTFASSFEIPKGAENYQKPKSEIRKENFTFNDKNKNPLNIPKGFENYQEAPCTSRVEGYSTIRNKNVEGNLKLPYYEEVFDMDCDKNPDVRKFYIPDLSNKPIAIWFDINGNGEKDPGEVRKDLIDEDELEKIIENKLREKIKGK